MENCSEKKCDKGSCHNTGCGMTDMMLRLADQSWEELIKEKMKKIFEENNGEKMDKIAQSCVASVNTLWQNKMAGMQGKEEAKQKIGQSFMG